MKTRPTRRDLIAGTGACLAAPGLLWGQEGDAVAAFPDVAGGLEQLHALVVDQGGETVFAEAFRGPGLERAANIKSVSKSIVALLTGIAIERDEVESVDQRVLPMLGYDDYGDGRDALSVGDLLSMRTGLASQSGPNYGAWISSPDWVRTVIEAELVDEPGGEFIYSTGGWHVLGACLARATGTDLLEQARSRIGAPLGIDFAPWVRDPQGRYLGGNEMAVSPLGLARIGRMALAEGRFGGSQVVPSDWIETSWQPRARSPFSGDMYGYGWFLTRFAGLDAAYGRGYGGQVLAVVPDADLTVAITSDPTRPARSRGYFGDLKDLIEQIVGEVADRSET